MTVLERQRRTGPPRRMVLVLALALAQSAFLVVSDPVVAQSLSPTRTSTQAERGWIGFSFDVPVGEGEGRPTHLVVRHVVEGSPAEGADFRVGDRIVRIDDRPVTTEVLQGLASLSPGDFVGIELERNVNGEWWRRPPIRLQAARRPISEPVTLPEDLVVRINSRIKRLDSLSSEIGRLTEGGTSFVFRDLSGQSLGFAGGLPQVMAKGPDSTRTVVFSVRSGDGLFAGTVFSTETTNRTGPTSTSSIRVSVRTRGGWIGSADDDQTIRRTELQRALDDVARAEEERRVELRRISEPAFPLLAPDDALLKTLTARRKEIEAEIGRGAEGSPFLRPFDWVVDERVASTPVPSGNEVVWPGARLLSPYFTGESRVAGASLVRLNPELASYFSVEGGLLVTGLTPGAPADRAGLVPGDVLMRAGEIGLASVDDLRRALSRWEAGPLTITLVRRGTEREARFTR